MSKAVASSRDHSALVASARDGLTGANPEKVLAWAFGAFDPELIAICTSLQHEGMVLVHMAARINPQVRIFTIDSGRLPEETLELVEETRARYGVAIEVVYPDADEVTTLVSSHGPNLFYESTELRLRCCEVRKVRPLMRRLRGLDAWITGLRREQNNTRSQAGVVEVDELHDGIVKVNPLVDWSEQEVLDYVERHHLPRNALYARGYTSIGCAPCTRPTEPGEDPRAGRWWWEQGARECGLHYRLVAGEGSTRRA